MVGIISSSQSLLAMSLGGTSCHLMHVSAFESGVPVTKILKLIVVTCSAWCHHGGSKL